MRLSDVLIGIQDMLLFKPFDPNERKLNIKPYILNYEAADILNKDKPAFEQIAREWVRKYAQ